MRILLFVITLSVCVGQQTDDQATAVLEKLKAGFMFPKTNRITDTTASLTSLDKREGAISSATIETAQPTGLTVKTYKTSLQRNRARQRLIKDCPGCVCLTECNKILIYERYGKSDDMNKIMRGRSAEYVGVLKKQYHCQ